MECQTLKNLENHASFPLFPSLPLDRCSKQTGSKNLLMPAYRVSEGENSFLRQTAPKTNIGTFLISAEPGNFPCLPHVMLGSYWTAWNYWNRSSQRPNCLFAAQPTVSQHWRQILRSHVLENSHKLVQKTKGDGHAALERWDQSSRPTWKNCSLLLCNVHCWNATQYYSKETVLLIFPFLQTNITVQMRPSGGWGRKKEGIENRDSVECRRLKKMKKYNYAECTI